MTPVVQSATGITPACAGRTSLGWLSMCGRWDHPRVRGENVVFDRPPGVHRGSPPRARGEHRRPSLACHPHRITPACAGRTAPLVGTNIRNSDHPRVRGENVAGLGFLDPVPGSPPRARGERHCRPRKHRKMGITPACAGRTIRRLVPGTPPWDHPRVRGENHPQPASADDVSGSPPRARGEQARLV